MWWLLLVPILAIFFLKDGHRMGERLVNSVEDARNRRIVKETVDQMNLMLGHYLRAQITLAGLAMVVVTFVLWIMRVPYALALGPAAGALEFIPAVGPAVGGLLVLAVALLSGYGHLFWLLVFLVFSGWVMVNSIFVWPHLLAGALAVMPRLLCSTVISLRSPPLFDTSPRRSCLVSLATRRFRR